MKCHLYIGSIPRTMHSHDHCISHHKVVEISLSAAGPVEKQRSLNNTEVDNTYLCRTPRQKLLSSITCPTLSVFLTMPYLPTIYIVISSTLYLQCDLS